MTTTVEIETENPLKLSVKGVQGTIDDKYVGRLRPMGKDTPLPELRKRLEDDGYLFLKHLIPRQDVMDVRKSYFEYYESLGMLQPGTSPEQGIFNREAVPSDHAGIGAGLLPPNEAEQHRMIASHKNTDYLRFLEHPVLRQMVRDLTGWEADILLQRTMLRHNIPGGLSTGVHYDKLFLRGGSAYFLTAWVPIGDISLNGGGLIYLSDSISLGHSMEEDFAARAKELPEAERVSAFNAHMGEFGQLSANAGEFHRDQAGGRGQWLVSDFEAGDVVFHDPYTIHGSSRNEDKDGRIRLSTDLRFYDPSSDYDKRWMKYWEPGDGL
ncbi:uncharacterized protein KY384_000239 [Bacidia gigantensis]|uniref:uncharacterized protein n=1 Tax=Bacidia gigantensis TaxID=2732470 RepID=UPI001D05AAD8|nr:uncharacterized protein KY384_000239 [Bacidia gigantensis]KAG8526246.1 hypothetical protein KY384_000239 [Bacidia gigantensis]